MFKTNGVDLITTVDVASDINKHQYIKFVVFSHFVVNFDFG